MSKIVMNVSRTLACGLKGLKTNTRSFSKSKSYEIPISEERYAYSNCPKLNSSITVTKDELLKMYKTVNKIRNFEIMCDELYKLRQIRGFCHLSTGQESIAAAIEASARPDDSLITSYRCHGMALIKGVSPEAVFAELMGRVTGSSKGKGGSMHIFGDNFFGGNGIVGAQVPLGAGLALANKLLGNGKAAFTLYGDGAANQGQVYEAFNMAKLWDLPCIFVCENNAYAMGTPVSISSASVDYYNKCPYIPGFRLDGLDVIATKNGFDFAREWVCSGKGPIIVEASTYRYVGHSMSDPGTTYRNRDEINDYRKNRDVITRLKEKILSLGAATESELKNIVTKVKEELEEAKEKAMNAPEPPESDLVEHVYHKKYPKTRLCVPDEWL